jgi:hypothetical protein
MIKRNKYDDGMRFLECATKPRFRCYQYDIANFFADASGDEKVAKKAKTRTVRISYIEILIEILPYGNPYTVGILT